MTPPKLWIRSPTRGRRPPTRVSISLTDLAPVVGRVDHVAPLVVDRFTTQVSIGAISMRYPLPSSHSGRSTRRGRVPRSGAPRTDSERRPPAAEVGVEGDRAGGNRSAVGTATAPTAPLRSSSSWTRLPSPSIGLMPCTKAAREGLGVRGRQLVDDAEAVRVDTDDGAAHHQRRPHHAPRWFGCTRRAPRRAESSSRGGRRGRREPPWALTA